MTGCTGTEHVRRLYDEMAGTWRLYNIVDSLTMINRLRKKHFSAVSGRVLDVACGTGENFAYLGRAGSVTALDVSPAMLEEARRRAGQMRFEVDLVAGDAGQMPFRAGGFDFVVSALSSCTFPDHRAAFQEMRRVTRPGGRILLLEHGRSTVAWIARRQDRNIGRVTERSACRNNRDVSVELAAGGLIPNVHETSHLGMLNRIVVEVG
jgi:ubiquinone/menaquinone biosynthesis C-methylase UbiE